MNNISIDPKKIEEKYKICHTSLENSFFMLASIRQMRTVPKKMIWKIETIRFRDEGAVVIHCNICVGFFQCGKG